MIMKTILVSLVLCLVLGCKSEKKKESKTSTIGFTTTTSGKTEKISNIDSLVTWMGLHGYDSAMGGIDLFQTLDQSLLYANAESGLAPKILGAMFPESNPYDIPVAVSDAACNEFFSIERKQFRSGTKTFYTSVTKNDDNKIKLFGLLKGDFKKNSKAFILDFCNYLDTTCMEGTTRKKVRLAAGLRIVYFVKDWGLNIGVDGLEKIAAAKELNFSESSLEVHTIGWGQDDAALDGLKSALQKISVKNYPEACTALINLLDAYKKATSLKPVVIPIE